MANEIADARKTIRDAFEADPGFKQGYIDNVAILLYDELGLEKKKRDKIADRILRRIFY